MSKLFFITNSVDGTADRLISICQASGIDYFRWNVDLWDDYQLSVSLDGSRIASRRGVLNLLSDDYILLWRKPFLDLIEDVDGIGEDNLRYLRRQIYGWRQYILALSLEKKSVRLVDPLAESRWPKLLQLRLASKYFKVPSYLFGTHDIYPQPRAVVKSLDDPSVSANTVLYTALVDPNKLHRPFPWFMQHPLIGGQDVTCVYINGSCNFYCCFFKRDDENIDWRVEINSPQQSSWRKLEHPDVEKWGSCVRSFMDECRLFYGRLDFILISDELYFLECNVNGQFGWLDDDSGVLHRAFLDAALSGDCIVE